ncbi:MAG: hypothetical protein BMS9Abin37_1855 [Acidobacteriota bacterium]|nr:MAG: hypothetical protein BMS9Abin37_1855 [Acidobacteriota bacterium]
MKRGLALFLSPMLLVSLIIGCGDDGGSSPTAPTTPQPSTSDSSLTAPTNRSPSQGEQLAELKPELEVGNATGGSGVRTYTFEVARDGAFQQIVATEAGVREGLGGITVWQVSETLEAETKYFWRSRASTGAGNGPNSASSTFRIKSGFTRDRPGGLVVFDPLTGGSVGQAMGGRFVAGGWQAQSNADCIRYQIPVLREGRIEFETTNVSSPNPVSGKRMLISMWDPSKGEYTTNPFRMHLQKLDRSTVRLNDVRLRWISRSQETNTGISFFDFEPSIVYSWRIEWGTFPGIKSQHVKVFLDEQEILNRNYDSPYSPNPHWVELGNCDRKETLEEAIWSNLRIGSR